MVCSPNLARVCGFYFDQGLVFIIDVGEIGCHGNCPWILSQTDKPRSNPELERQSFGGKERKIWGHLCQTQTKTPKWNSFAVSFWCSSCHFSWPTHVMVSWLDSWRGGTFVLFRIFQVSAPPSDALLPHGACLRGSYEIPCVGDFYRPVLCTKDKCWRPDQGVSLL